MKKITTGPSLTSIGRSLAKFHMTFFIVFIAAGLTVAVLFLNNLLSDTSGADNYTSPIDAGSIDQATLDRIKELHTSDEPVSEMSLPQGRINPFGE